MAADFSVVISMLSFTIGLCYRLKHNLLSGVFTKHNIYLLLKHLLVIFNKNNGILIVAFLLLCIL